MLRYLRQHGNYLTPGKGITLTSVIVVLLRGIILNLLVWIPIVAAVMWLRSGLTVLVAGVVVVVPGGAIEFVGSISPPRGRTSEPISPARLGTLLLAFGSMLAAVIRPVRPVRRGIRRIFARDLVGPQVERWFLGGTKYGWRRGFENGIRLPFWAIGVLLLLASVPFVVGSLHGWVLGSSFSLIGLASGLMAFVRTMQQPKSRAEEQSSWAIPSSWIASFGAAFLLYGVLLVSYAFGWWAAQGSADARRLARLGPRSAPWSSPSSRAGWSIST